MVVRVEIEIVRAVKADAMEFYKLEAKCFEMEGNDADTLYYWVPIPSYQSATRQWWTAPR